ncbi:MAG TPA: response regulator [Candidatus Colwellbacteria bacterium]|nr:response regulator [Candidatus Colwellbacteria bacterium]
MKILIIEDEEALARVIKEKFDKEGYDSVIVEEGEEALPKAKQFKPDVILLDLLLPKRNGFEILQDLKMDAELKTAPVIVLSNLGEDENIKRAILLGAADYFVKTQHPISEVVEKVRYVAERGR